ncbi:uncharacterized protein LOC100679891 isoform X2 [Nasonia vitripennis]|uniref:Potassium channel domain-containing protein n=1 Tax=Nasonia vitripennis TaxID=7425 RepID=A0A7M7Q8G7_NASVI|nr:uncharacterized protein LOC100679891 isoform X2 [Nasonia vitripennis]
MDIPAFPEPPAPVSRSVSLDTRESLARRRGNTREGLRRRPRSASWLVAHKHAPRRSRRSNHVRPFIVAETAAVVVAAANRTELTLTMTESRYDESNADVQTNTATGTVEVLERIKENQSPRTIKEDQVNEADIICRASIEAANHDLQRAATPTFPKPISERLPPIRSEETSNSVTVTATTAATLPHKTLKSTSVQTIGRILYRLRVFPTLKDIVDEENKPPDPKKSPRLYRYFRFLGRVALCQFGLAWLLTLWAVLGAGAFYITEGPRERQQVVELKDMQRDLAVGLATELRQLRADEKEMEPLWSNKVRQYVARHEKLLLIAVSSGYGEGGNNGQLWTFPGCVLFAISVLTTLGFGAPVPRTNAGRTVAVIFAAIGIPAHFLLVLNLGLLLAVRLKRYGIARKYKSECRDQETLDSLPMPMWVKVVPFAGIGILCFGVARMRPFSDSLLYPLDFTAAGGLSTITGYVRILYGLFLEGAVTLAAMAVAVLKVSATQSLTNVGLKYGLLVPA